MSFSSSSSGPVMNPGAQGMYNQLLGLNQQNYAGMVNAFGQAMSNQNSQLGGIYAGYDALLGKVENTLGMGAALGKDGNWGVATPAAMAIRDSFERARGETDQGLINAGLGSTTMRGSLQNQNALQAGQAYGNLGAQLAQSLAGYQSSLGQAGLQARMGGLAAQTGLASQFGNAMGNYRFANTFGNLYGQQSSSQSSSGGGGGGGGSGGGGSGGGGGFNMFGGFDNLIGAGGRNGMGSAGAYTQPGSYDPYGVGGGSGELNNGMFYDYDQGGNYGGAFNNGNLDWGTQGAPGSGDFGGGGDF